jgi:hypothetical protein
MESGYRSRQYAESFSDFATAHELVESGSRLLLRAIPGSPYRDAMGCYPLFSCARYEALATDLSRLPPDVVSVVLVTDPMDSPAQETLSPTFNLVIPYKTHYVLPAGTSLEGLPRKAHAKNVRRGLRKLDVEHCPNPLDYLQDWLRLYGVLIARHSIEGLRRFSPSAFAMQFATPGFQLFRASVSGQTVGLHIWYRQAGGVHSHLSAFDPLGYSLDASYALQWRAIEYFHSRGLWINLGGGSSIDGTDGLSAFKQGFARDGRRSLLCGKVLQQEAYKALCERDSEASPGTYFPSYRRRESQPVRQE